ncbi:hypothetical protein PC112_g21780 [Phytophthora cactorum]|uniref:Uncharacterized protein n=3 Tax=Phytophthora cactorum TaxID=29920 RepID=A0A8T1ABW9_9STRA|nr:hypothetical protein PC112_g21780 [Phytophthora cactorum]KAG2875317.1 hypothetical protein PC115_g23941 [Phytophthora cactorum]KAG3124450.1 hypothetical protein C6341_g26152 [Phytophthora cactorum]
MTKGGLNRAIDRAFMALVPRRVREHEDLQGDTDHSNTQQPPEAALSAPPVTSAPMNPAPAPSAPSEAPPALPAMAEVPAEPPAAPPVAADASAPVTEASLQAMLIESSEASVDQMMTSMIPYLTAIRRLNSAVGFDDVLAAVQPLSDSIPDLPRRIGELEVRLRSAEADAATTKRSVVSQMLARESAEQLLKISSSKVESLEAENRRLRATNIRVDALLQKIKESTGLHTQDLELARAEERETLKAAVAANTEQTRQLHAILIKAQKGKFVDADIAHSLEDLQKRNTHLLHINRVIRSHVGLAGMDPEILVLAVQGMTAGELNLADLELDQETFVALQRIQAEAAGSSDPHAVPAALAKASHQVAHGKLHKRIRPGGEDSDNDLGVDSDSSSEDKPPIPTDQASSVMSAASLGDNATTEPSSPKSGRRVICSFSIKSKFALHKSSLAVAFPISVSHEVVNRSSEVSVAVGV